MFGKVNNPFFKFVYNHIVWLSMTIGAAILVLSYHIGVNSTWGAIFEKLGLSIFTSGVFAAILKSFQFTGIFKQEIEKVILDSKFIEKRNDLPHLWKKISKFIYDRKFPEISERLQSIILDEYFPTEHKYYYENAVYTLRIENIDRNNIITYIQNVRLDLVKAKGVDEVEITHKHVFRDVKDLDVDKIYFKVDGTDILETLQEEAEEEEVDGRITKVYKHKLSEGKKHTIEYKDKRQYCLNNDNYKLFRVKKMTKEMDVSVAYQDGMNVTFFDVGLVEPFEEVHVDHENQINKKYKKGLILPYQGFGITIARSNN